ncbi:hypothetical protein EDD17DRAFT_1758532 [Pisolithus thermaeus]|nr:hypothetical protein EV401DRAFT_2068533 [Pisolithus croceorrhizus]KAI6161684.1 hypothetical protein EDD17DRAFT_1758532 [Pisolithus thermaeus]
MSPCPIQLSDVGRCYHPFPKGSFKAHFTPLILPKLVLHHFTAHPPSWTWATKDGPSVGKSFKVPTIPVSCDCSAPQAVQWIIAVFHSFKTHLNPVTLDPKSGRVLPGWLHLYQNNMYIHLQSQLKAGSSSTQATTSLSKPPPTQPPPSPPTTTDPVSELWEELQLLYERFYLVSESSSEDDGSPSHPPSPSPSAPFTIMDASPEGPVRVPNPHLGYLEPIDCHLPARVNTAVRLIFAGSPPFYLSIRPDDQSLYVATWAEHSLEAATLKLPADPSMPMDHP